MRKQYLGSIALVGVLAAGLLMVSSQVRADDTSQLKEQVQALQNRVNQLESELANKQQISVPTVVPAYDIWEDPFVHMMRMRQQMERNMHRAFADTGAFTPKMDMKQTNQQYIITMDVPGMDKDKINVEIKGGMLVVSGERRSETQDNKNNQYYRKERSFGSFMQAIPLPGDAQADQIEAKYKNGVLTVTVARVKKEEKKSGSEKIMVK